MRFDVKKYLFVGLEEDRSLFFSKAQEEGIIHFIDAKASTVKHIPQNAQDILKAIKILRGLPTAEQEEVVNFEITQEITQQILLLKEKSERLNEESRSVALDMARVEPFGDFSLNDIDYIQKEGHCKVQFYCAKMGKVESSDDEVLYVTSANGLDYFVAFNLIEKQYPHLIEMFVDNPWGTLKKRHQEISNEKHICEAKLKEYAKYNNFLHHALIDTFNDHQLQQTSNYIQTPTESEMIFSVEGWVPNNKESILQQFISEMNVHAEEIANDPNDVAPTYLENTGAARIGEDLVHIYDTPSNADKDPSVWVLVFFALFFSMIIGDGGYGLIMLLVALYIRNKHTKLTKAGKRTLDLVTILAFSVIAWGVLTTSFFGVTIAPDSSLRKVSLMSWLVEKKVDYHIQHHDETYQGWIKTYPQLATSSDPTEFLMQAHTTSSNGLVSYDAYNKFSDNIMMELALFVGVLHIILSMLRYIRRNPQNIGWVIFLVGAYLYTPIFLGAVSLVNFVFGIDQQAVAQNAIYMMYGGAAIAVIIAIYKHRWLGLLEATVVIQIFGDVLSYLRLYALGLSGSMLTATMNEMAASSPLVFGILILILGHIVNLVLSIMGGVIHGLRLNFLEWYHYCFEGGGKMFNPLKKIDIE
ncbi:MAG: V-type ATP synthase subunit I [Parachlamydiaceae bacterium]|nr:V-type ATP synthase subunit I [Parachlamydiaceae bacterium]